MILIAVHRIFKKYQYKPSQSY